MPFRKTPRCPHHWTGQLSLHQLETRDRQLLSNFSGEFNREMKRVQRDLKSGKRYAYPEYLVVEQMRRPLVYITEAYMSEVIQPYFASFGYKVDLETETVVGISHIESERSCYKIRVYLRDFNRHLQSLVLEICEE